MTYTTLGARGPITGIADNTTRNSGNWTVTFDPVILNVNMSEFEVYKMIVKGAVGSAFDVYVDQKQWDTSVFGQSNSWDPMQPLIMRPGETLYFFYNDPTSDNSPPVITIWLRYDPLVAQRIAG
jgi:hypothetical protein